MNDLLLECPLCDSEQLAIFSSLKDYSISKENFTLSQCQTCDFVFTNPRPSKTSISKYYESPDYISHSNSKKGIFNKVYQLIRDYSIRKKIKLISSFADTDKSIMDFGCGTGEFLNACFQAGWTATGIEPNQKARTFAIDTYHLDVKDELNLNQIPLKSLKIITLWHVLEHVHDVNERIENFSLLLKDSGFLIIAVPNHKSYDASYYNNHWAAFDVPRHLYHFSEKTIKELFSRHKFSWVKSFPMKFDSFYVSMLSEKYKGNKFPFLKAIYIGLKSNLLAKGNPEKFSSVIYIFKK